MRILKNKAFLAAIFIVVGFAITAITSSFISFSQDVLNQEQHECKQKPMICEALSQAGYSERHGFPFLTHEETRNPYKLTDENRWGMDAGLRLSPVALSSEALSAKFENRQTFPLGIIANWTLYSVTVGVVLLIWRRFSANNRD